MKTHLLSLVFLSLFLVSCSETKKPAVLVELPEYTSDFASYESRVKKEIKVISSDLGLSKVAPINGLTYLSFVTVPIHVTKEFGKSKFHDETDLEEIKKAIQKHLKTSKLGILAGSSRSDKEIDFYVYTSDKLAWKDEVEILKTEFPESGLTELAKEEKGWESYFQFLQPDQNQQWIIDNSRKKQQLIDDEVDISKDLVFQHTFYFRTDYNRRRMLSELQVSGFRLVTLAGQTGNKQHPFLLIVSNEDNFENPDFNQTILNLWELGKRRYALYQGWEVKIR